MGISNWKPYAKNANDRNAVWHPNRENCFLMSFNGWVGGKSFIPHASAASRRARSAHHERRQGDGRSRELLAVEHNDAAASHPATLLLGGERAPNPVAVAREENGGANEHPNTAARTKPDFSELPPPPPRLAKLNAFMPEMRRANAELEEAMKTRPAGD